MEAAWATLNGTELKQAGTLGRYALFATGAVDLQPGIRLAWEWGGASR